MQLKELTKLISEDSGFSQTDVTKLLESYRNIVTNTLSQGEEVKIVGFMSLKVATREARKGRNPQTGKEIDIAASKVVRLTVGQSLKDSVNGKTSEEFAKKSNTKKENTEKVSKKPATKKSKG